MTSDRQQIEQLLNTPESQLFAQLVTYLPEYQNVLFAPGTEEATGRQWLSERAADLRRALCHEWDVVRKLDSPDMADNISLVSAMAAVIGGLSAYVPPVLIAVLIFKIGIRNFCAGSAKA